MRSAPPVRSRPFLALVTLLAAAGLVACGGPDLASDGPTASPAAAASVEPVATLPVPDVVLIDAPVALAGLLATIESAYEIGRPNVDLVVALHDPAEMETRLFDEAPADVFLVDVETGTARSATAVSTNEPVAFSTEYVALLADRSFGGGPALSFLSWLMGPEGQAIVTTSGLTPHP